MKTIILLFLFISVSYSQSLLTILAPEEEVSVVNIVTNGDFEVGTGWTLQSGITIGAGVLNYNVGSGYNAAIQNIGLEAGKTYGYSIDVVVTSGGVRVNYHNGSYTYLHPTDINSSGTYSGTAEIVGTPNGSLYLRSDNGFVGTVDNIVIWVIE